MKNNDKKSIKEAQRLLRIHIPRPLSREILMQQGRSRALGSARLTCVPGHSWEPACENTLPPTIPRRLLARLTHRPPQREEPAGSCQFQSAYFKQPLGMRGTCARGWTWLLRPGSPHDRLLAPSRSPGGCQWISADAHCQPRPVSW